MSLFLSQPLHVPSITKNLIIVSKFALDNCVFFEFHLNHCLVKSQVSNEILLQGSLLVLMVCMSLQICNFKAQLLFQLLALFLTLNDFNSDVNTVSTASTCTCTGSKTLWHLRLAHPSSNVLKLVLNHFHFLLSLYS